jgi:hypothetical protein
MPGEAGRKSSYLQFIVPVKGVTSRESGMRLRKRKSSLDDWLDRGTTPEKFWKLLFYFFSRFILLFCILHFFGVAYPDSGWAFPGPTSEVFWAFCVLFSAIFATVFYVIRTKRKVSGEAKKQILLHPSEQAPTPMNKFTEDPGARRGSLFATDRKKSDDNGKSSPEENVEEKREGRYGGVGRATFVSEPESEEERGEHEGDRRQ